MSAESAAVGLRCRTTGCKGAVVLCGDNARNTALDQVPSGWVQPRCTRYYMTPHPHQKTACPLRIPSVAYVDQPVDGAFNTSRAHDVSKCDGSVLRREREP